MTSSITPLPPAPSRSDPVNFAQTADTFVAALAQFVTDANNLAAGCDSDAATTSANAATSTTAASAASASATAAAASATAAGAASGAVAWVSGHSYTAGNVVYSTLNYQSYRCSAATSGTTDPSLDSSHWAYLGLNLGLGGAITSGSVTLTAASTGTQAITPTKPGQYVILPDATACILGSDLFSILNQGDYALGIKDNAGNQLGWVAPRKTAEICLVDHTTSAGVWACTNLVKLAVTASLYSFANTGAGSTIVRIALDANRSMLLFSPLTASNVLQAVVYDASTQTWGAITQIATPMSSFGAILSATNQVLVAYANGSTTLTGVTLSVSGTTITVNATATATLGGNAAAGIVFQVAQVGSAFAFGINRATSVASLVVMTISGTTVTCGSEVALATAAAATAGTFFLYAVSSSVLLTIVQSNGGTSLVACPYSISGTTPTVGTSVTLSGVSGAIFKCGVIGSNWYVLYSSGSSPYSLQCSILTVASTTATASTVAVFSGIGTTYVAANFDVTVIGSKIVVSGFCNSAGSNNLQSNIVTNTSGTASAGTNQAYTVTPGGNVSLVTVAGNVARFVATVTSNVLLYYSVDATGATAVVTFIDFISNATFGATVPAPQSNARNNGVIANGASWFCPAVSYSLAGNASKMCMQNNFIEPDVATNPTIQSQSNLYSGANQNEVWHINSQFGTLLQRIECAP